MNLVDRLDINNFCEECLASSIWAKFPLERKEDALECFKKMLELFFSLDQNKFGERCFLIESRKYEKESDESYKYTMYLGDPYKGFSDIRNGESLTNDLDKILLLLFLDYFKVYSYRGGGEIKLEEMVNLFFDLGVMRFVKNDYMCFSINSLPVFNCGKTVLIRMFKFENRDNS